MNPIAWMLIAVSANTQVLTEVREFDNEISCQMTMNHMKEKSNLRIRGLDCVPVFDNLEVVTKEARYLTTDDFLYDVENNTIIPVTNVQRFDNGQYMVNNVMYHPDYELLSIN